MHAIKLFAGVILLAAGAVLATIVMVVISRLTVDFSTSYGIGSFTGSAILVLALMLVSFFMIKYGVRLARKKH